MQPDELRERLTEALPKGKVLSEEPLRLHTTFRVGGPAELYVRPGDEEELIRAVSICRGADTPLFILGNGSNILASDKGFRGVVIEIGRSMSGILVDGERILAGAGATLAAIAREALLASLDGLAFAAGIPGTLGGACVMNAGAYDHEMKDVLESVRLVFPDGQIREMSPAQLHFTYRSTDIPALGAIVTGASFRLVRGDAEIIRARMEELREQRQEKQPLDLPSAGSTFKRPQGDFAGRLIEAAGLRGYSVGEAMVSEKHCGFVVNRGRAASKDIARVITHVQKTVLDMFGVLLEPEVRYLGEFREEERCLFPGR
ncbi:MAG: UDP-N-acetylmuramate dehydrogenase [Lachnospiraceae bacterium]